MFDDECPDWLLILLNIGAGLALFLPALFCFLSYKNSGVEDPGAITQVIIGCGISLAGFLGLIIACTEFIMDYETAYIWVGIISAILWLVGTIIAMNNGIYNQDIIALANVNSNVRWAMCFGLGALGFVGLSIIGVALKMKEIIHSGIQNIISLGAFALCLVTAIISASVKGYNVINAIAIISLVPFIIAVISMVIGWIKDR